MAEHLPLLSLFSNFDFRMSGKEWYDVFQPNVPLTEIFVRGTIMYLTLFILLRVTLKRESGSMSITDMLVIVLLADASQNAMAGGYNSIPDGVLLVVTIMFWSYFLNWLSYRWPWLRRIIQPAPLLLIYEGKMMKGNMKKELITEDELDSILREQGVDDVDKIKKAYMEPDGQISILLRSGKKHDVKLKKKGNP